MLYTIVGFIFTHHTQTTNRRVIDLLFLVLRIALKNDVYATYRVIIVKVGVKLGQQVRAPVKVRDVSRDPDP